MMIKGLRCSRRALRQYQRSQSGVTAIEFAFVAPPFLALLLAIFEVGIMLFSEYVIEHGVTQAARMIRTGEVQAQNMDSAAFKTLVCGRLAGYLDCDQNLFIDVRDFDDFDDPDLKNLPPPLTEEGELSSAVTSGTFEPGGAHRAVVVRVYYPWSLFTPGVAKAMSNMSDGRRLLAAGATFRNEPFGNVGG